MKANAPEKIYVSQHSGLHFYKKQNDDDIEYILTDAFIEKAWSWIEDNMLYSNQQDKAHSYYKQFINCMEGE